MKYKNVSDKVINFKVKEAIFKDQRGKEHVGKNVFVAVEPGEVVELPIRISEKGMELVVEKEVEKEDSNEESELEFLDEIGLNKLTKDKLNDYAAVRKLKDVTTKMTKDQMVESILESQEEEEDEEDENSE